MQTNLLAGMTSGSYFGLAGSGALFGPAHDGRLTLVGHSDLFSLVFEREEMWAQFGVALPNCPNATVENGTREGHRRDLRIKHFFKKKNQNKTNQYQGLRKIFRKAIEDASAGIIEWKFVLFRTVDIGNLSY